MNHQLEVVMSRIVLSLPLWCAVSAALLCTRSAQAAPVTFSISIQSVTASAGSNGNILEVDLTNNSSSDQPVGAFNFTIQFDSSNITFTEATTATTTPYIFNGDSLADAISGSILGTSTDQTLTASDLSLNSITNPDVVAAGQTVGLGEVFFDVAPNTPAGPITVTLLTDPASTSFTPPLGGILPSDQAMARSR